MLLAWIYEHKLWLLVLQSAGISKIWPKESPAIFLAAHSKWFTEET